MIRVYIEELTRLVFIGMCVCIVGAAAAVAVVMLHPVG